MFNFLKGLFTKIQQYRELSKKIAETQKIIDLREQSLARHNKRSLKEYYKSGIAELMMKQETLEQARANLFKKQIDNGAVLRVKAVEVQITDVKKPRKTRSDKGTKRVVSKSQAKRVAVQKKATKKKK